jgi:hypothetical protein
MNKIIVTSILLLLTIFSFAKEKPLYVAYSTGINIRKAASLNADLLGKIPYATKLSIDVSKKDTMPVFVEGMTGYWVPVSFQNKKGYILDCYLTNSTPPKKGTKTMADYMLQLSPKFGSPLLYKSPQPIGFYESGYEIKKQFYKNGNEMHESKGYESFGNTYFFVQMESLQEAFLVMRQIEEFNLFFSEKDEFPNQTKIVTKKSDISNTVELTYTIDKTSWGKIDWIKKITLEYQEGASYELEIFYLDGHIVVSYGGGV